jgi:hypothetical protein
VRRQSPNKKEATVTDLQKRTVVLLFGTVVVLGLVAVVFSMELSSGVTGAAIRTQGGKDLVGHFL